MSSAQIFLSLALAASSSTATSLDLLYIEQRAWLPWTGQVTKPQLVRYLASLLYSEAYQDQIDCGLSGGSVVCVVDVYPKRAGLAYQFFTSHGQLSARSEALVVIEAETVDFQMATAASPQYPPREILSVAWAGPCYLVDGTEIAQPLLTIEGSTLVSARACLGTALVSYRTERHSYVLTAPRRDTALDNHYSAVVWGVYSGGLNYLAIELPPTIAEFEADAEAVCGWGGSATVTTQDPDSSEVQPSPKNRRTVYDYCSQLIASDTYY